MKGMEAHSDHLRDKKITLLKFFQVKSGDSTCGVKGSFIIQKNGPGNENLPEKNEFYKDKSKVVYLGKESIIQVESFCEYELKI